MTSSSDIFAAADLLRARYGADPQTLPAQWNETLSTILGHRSIRSYQNTPLPAGTLETLMAAAQSAATSSNLQTWSVVAVTDSERKDRLATLANNQEHIRQCPLFLVWLADLARLAHAAGARELPHAGLDYLEMYTMAVVDAALAAQNATIAAESLGLGMVYIGAMRNHPEAVAAELKLPPRVFAVFGMCVGYADPEPPAAVKPRLPQPAVVHQEAYSVDNLDAEIEQYIAAMQRFYEAQQMQVRGNWVRHSARRIAGPESLSGRDRLREALNNLGFDLK